MRFFVVIAVCCFITISGYSQQNGRGTVKAAHAYKYEDLSIQLDGSLDESVWQDIAHWTGEFYQYFPSDTSFANAQTKVKIVYDDKFLYVAAIMYNLEDRDEYVSTSLRRDYRGDQNDGVSFVFDTFNDNTNAFLFGVNPYGVQRESLIANGGAERTDLNLAWDNKWYSAAKIYDNYWVVELAIPFSTLRYKDNASEWNANFYRIDSKYNERSSWARIPRNFSLISVAFTHKIYFSEPLRKYGANISLIPYAAAGQSRNKLEGTRNPIRPSFGGDAKLGVGPALNLDLTVNPDFSQVEVDEQVTNLDRFEIFFPERRQFFLENADLFADFGTPTLRPFFSRRIGVDRDESTGQNVQNQILFGGRLSGKITDDWRVGLMNMQTANDDEKGISGKNFSVAAVQKKVFARSNIGVIMINRESLNTASESGLFDTSDYNRLLGIDYNLASGDNRWTGKFFYHKSFDAQSAGNSGALHGQLNYNDLHVTASVSYSDIGESFDPKVGFAPRNDYKRIASSFAYQFFPVSDLINRHGPGIESENLWNETYGNTDELYTLFYDLQFQSQSILRFSMNRRYTYLFSPFDPTRTQGEPLASDTGYGNNFWGFRYVGNPRMPLFFTLIGQKGEYFTGNINSLQGIMNWRIGYIANISMNFSYNNIVLPKPQNSANLILAGPRIDLTLSKDLFITTFFQYNNQINNININTRLQWRYAPVSDLFIVYTENYFPSTFASKQRALVMKLSYWLNI
ncbi:MAG: carbohydrate binding family 9 domain-containing protein [Cyclobacteriaceae bacterium]|nr:carbohydrate binding family 9 domain-containing protein [Cyclobacteriaceae bacterium]